MKARAMKSPWPFAALAAFVSLATAPPAAAGEAPPTLTVLPAAHPADTTADSAGPAERETVAEALRLGAEVTGRFRIPSVEEEAPRFGGAARIPRNCFTERCVAHGARKAGTDFVLASEFERSIRDTMFVLKLALYEAASGKVKAALLARARSDSTPLIPFAKAAAQRLCEGGGDSAAGPWNRIGWLKGRDTVDNRRVWKWAGGAALGAAVAMAWAQGQLFQTDDNGHDPGNAVLSGTGAYSFLRGFFAAPTLGAQYAAMGGAGVAQVDNALAVLFNPAGVADVGGGTGRESVVMAKRSLPGGVPSFFLAYAGPLWNHWSQGLAVQYEGDGLANETTFNGDLAYDWSALGEAWAWLKTGAGLKVYLAKVGAEGTGYDRSTGHSYGMGLDLGLRVKLSPRITGALALRDVASFLRHKNTFTGESYGEVLPPEYRLGAAYRVSPHLLLVMDGQKGVWADQADHVRLGVEKVAFGFLALRGGLHEIFGREEVRKFAVGFGIDTEGMGDVVLKQRLAINYAYEFGIDESEPLGGGQQFSLEVSF
jgi:hypothetical protein